MGSSPLSRGIPGRGRTRRWCGGIIPALAGNTPLWPMQKHEPEDHPRSRGEYVRCGLADLLADGLSSHGLGVLVLNDVSRRGRGIIPALAGNTLTDKQTAPPVRDHPRSRGEYRCKMRLTTWASGSSPLSRGIPTRDSGEWSTTQDHPRSRGEYSPSAFGLFVDWGSSPLSRGIRCDRSTS